MIYKDSSGSEEPVPKNNDAERNAEVEHGQCFIFNLALPPTLSCAFKKLFINRRI